MFRKTSIGKTSAFGQVESGRKEDKLLIPF